MTQCNVWLGNLDVDLLHTPVPGALHQVALGAQTTSQELSNGLGTLRL